MRFLLIIVAGAGLVWTLSRVRRRDVRRRELIGWGIVWILVAAVAVVPEGTNRLADLLGIGRGADVVVYSALVVMVVLHIRQSVRMERMDRDITIVTREIASQDFRQRGDAGGLAERGLKRQDGDM
ncbi:MAG: DUF2304 domain-containing protein [Candidatus Uhrbacteria bacterium]